MDNYLTTIKKRILKHKNNCKNYKNFLNSKKVKINKIKKLKDVPFIHVNMFKEYDLISVKKKEISLQLNSSGTSGKQSKIFLDKKNSINQKKYLTKILQNEFGLKRYPFLILGQNPLFIKDRSRFAAQVAAFLGFSLIGRNFFYLKDKNNQIDYSGLNIFLRKYSKEKFLIFGFTSSVYEILISQLNKNKIKFSLSNSTIIHGGGWKKLNNLGLTNSDLKKSIYKKYRIKKLINYFGFVEQTGSIFLECSLGNFHTNEITNIYVRDKNLNLSKRNEEGILQCISIVPSSYPGNSIILEDKAIFKGKNCKCGKPGKIFTVTGRLSKTEVRGCSDIS